MTCDIRLLTSNRRGEIQQDNWRKNKNRPQISGRHTHKVLLANLCRNAQNKPSSLAFKTACARSLASNLLRILVRWFFTVPSAIKRRSEISLLLAPVATTLKTSSSRSVSGSGKGCGRRGACSESRANSATTLAATEGCKNDSPRAAARIASSNFSEGASHHRQM
jgi:hypothetical protein